MKLALTNVPPDRADSIARALVEEGRAACVNQFPIRSCYRWKGEVCREDEVTLAIKVADHGVEALRRRVLELHPYEVPEFIVVGIDEVASHAPYLAWVTAETRRD